jgi:hypothetical protein
MAAIAPDEARHASLSWRIADWVEPMLDEAARARVAAARQAAVEELRREVAETSHESWSRVVGLPPARDALAMVSRLDDALWSRASNSRSVLSRRYRSR